MRTPLPNRRHCDTLAFEHKGQKYYLTVGYFPDWRPGEIFLCAGKAGTDIEAMARDAAVGVSLALQYGCPLDVLRQAMTRLDNPDAAGALGKALDLVAEAQ